MRSPLPWIGKSCHHPQESWTREKITKETKSTLTAGHSISNLSLPSTVVTCLFLFLSFNWLLNRCFCSDFHWFLSSCPSKFPVYLWRSLWDRHLAVFETFACLLSFVPAVSEVFSSWISTNWPAPTLMLIACDACWKADDSPSAWQVHLLRNQFTLYLLMQNEHEM